MSGLVNRRFGRRRRAAHFARGQQQPDRHERQPEARLQQRPRVERGHHHRRSSPHQRPAPAQAGRADQGGGGEHQHGALRRHAPAGEGRIRQRRRQPAPARRQGRGTPQHGAPTAPPRPVHRQAGQPREHGHVQAADRHEMRHAGVAVERPVVALDRRLVAHRQRGQHAGRGGISQSGDDGVAHRLAQPVERCAARRCEQSVAGTGRATHVTGGAHALLEQPQLVVEAMRVHRAVRALQTQCELPALPGLQRRQGLAAPRIPADRQARRQGEDGRAGARRLDLQAKAQRLGRALRQPGDDAHDNEIAAFEFRRQGIGQPPAGAQAGGRKSEQRSGQRQCQHRQQRGALPARSQQPDHDGRGNGQQRGIGRCVPQRSLAQLQRRARHERCAHRQRPGQRSARGGRHAAV